MLGDLSQMVLAQSLSHPGVGMWSGPAVSPPDGFTGAEGSISKLANSCLSAGSLSSSPHGPHHKFLKCLHGTTANFSQSEWSRRKQGRSYSAPFDLCDRICEGSDISPICRPSVSLPQFHGSWHKTQDLWVGGRTWSLMAQQAAGLSAYLHLFLLLPSPTLKSWWIPVHEVSSITGEEFWT